MNSAGEFMVAAIRRQERERIARAIEGLCSHEEGSDCPYQLAARVARGETLPRNNEPA